MNETVHQEGCGRGPALALEEEGGVSRQQGDLGRGLLKTSRGNFQKECERARFLRRIGSLGSSVDEREFRDQRKCATTI